MNEVSEDIHALTGDLQRVDTRYIEEVEPNILDINENSTRVKDFLGILNLLRSETEYIAICLPKLKMLIRKLWSHL